MSRVGSATDADPRAEDPRRTLFDLLRPYRRDLRATVGNGVSDQVFAIASAMLAAYMVARAVRGATADQLWPWFVLLGFLVVPQLRMRWLEFIGAQSIANRIRVDLRAQVFDAFERLAPGFLLKRRSGDLAVVAMSDVDELQRFFATSYVALVVGVVVPILSVVALAIASWRVALALLPMLVLAASLPWWVHRRAEERARVTRQLDAEIGAVAVDTVQGMREILAFGDGAATLERVGARADEATRARIRGARDRTLERSVAETLTTLGLIAALFVSAPLVPAGALRPTLVPMIAMLAWLAFGPLVRIHHAAGDLRSATASSGRISELLREPPPVADTGVNGSVSPQPLSVRFDRVSFRYDADRPNAVDRVSFDIPAGATVALVGHSGAGKSTVVQLLMRFFDVDAGTITVNGVDVREVPLRALHGLIAYVPQDVYLFNLSAADNIRLGRPEAADEEVRTAAGQALADEFISALPNGYASILGERGARLSGGQRQRIAIARALLTDAPVLVMDEPVSSLDVENELALREGMARLRSGRTTLVIAHRLSTIRSADALIVMERGRVVGTGTHEQLLLGSRSYHRLIGSQIEDD